MSMSVLARMVPSFTGRRALRSLSSRNFSSGVKYLASHEYIRVEGDIGVVGISDFAQAQLGDVVYVDLPQVGDEFAQGEVFGSVESVKAASDVYAPLSGTVTEVNEELQAGPEMVNTHAMTDAWFVKLKIKDESEASSLLDETAYDAHCKAESA